MNTKENKNNCKFKYIVIGLLGVVLIVAILIWGHKSKKETDNLLTSNDSTEVFSESKPEIVHNEDITTEIIDDEKSQIEPQFKTEQSEMECMVDRLKMCTKDPIYQLIYDDFDNDGTNEAYALCGTKEIANFYGTLFFINDTNVYEILSNCSFLDKGELFSFDNEKIMEYTILREFTNLTYFFGVEDNEFVMLEASGKGEIIYYDTEGRVTIAENSYGYANGKRETYSYNPYYFYWDDGLKEYGGTSITIDDFIQFSGSSNIVERIEQENGEITSIFTRQNGIVNINYSTEHEQKNMRCILRNNVLSADITEGDGLNTYNSIGTIQAALVPEIATYQDLDNEIYDQFSITDEGIDFLTHLYKRMPILNCGNTIGDEFISEFIYMYYTDDYDIFDENIYACEYSPIDNHEEYFKKVTMDEIRELFELVFNFSPTLPLSYVAVNGINSNHVDENYYYISCSDPHDRRGWQEYKGYKVFINNNSVMAEIIFETVSFSDEENLYDSVYYVQPADNKYGFIIVGHEKHLRGYRNKLVR